MSDPQEHLDRAWQAVQQQVDAAPTSQQALERAAAFNKAVATLRSRAVELLRQTATRIAEEEKLSLRYLASIIGVSRSRAGQLLDPDEAAKAKAARAARKGKGE